MYKMTCFEKQRGGRVYLIRRRKAAPESDTTVHKIGLISKNFTGFHSNKKGQFSAAGGEGLPVFRLFTALILFWQNLRQSNLGARSLEGNLLEG